MRILVANYEMPPVGGGGGVAALKLAQAWAGSNEVWYVTSRAPGLAARETVGGVRVLRVPVASRGDDRAASLASLLAFPVTGLGPTLRLLRLRRFDVINTHFAVPSGPLGWAASAVSRVPNVVSIHGGDIYDPTKLLSPHCCPPVGWVVRNVLERADHVVAQSSDTAGNAGFYYGEGFARRMTVIPLPFDSPPAEWMAAGRATLRAQLGMEPDGFWLISVGRLVERKGYDRLIESLTLMPAEVRLVIVGSGPLEGSLRARAEALGLAARVRLTGWVDERQKYGYLAASDVYVLSSHHEGFGIVLQEAMSAGLPIVATRHGGQTDVLADGENALLIGSNESVDIATAVGRLMANAGLRRRMGAANRTAVLRYASAVVAERYLDVFRTVIARARGRRR